MMPIHDLGPGEMGRHGLERAQDAIDASRAKRERFTDGVGDAAGAEIHRTAAADGATSDGSSARPATESPAGDRVELSVAARALSAGEDPQVAARHAQHLAEIRSAIDAGTLSTPERLERAATRLLGG
jgi:hypothetical protein